MDKASPKEYAEIAWEPPFTNEEVMCIHLLMVRPSMAGKGIAASRR